ncbi:hypothetical protein FSARC_568 [Fusarium sarcochroum]|uniref:TerD domain-containing protein n=1 Tax=Fusarium sarcochroum TaxID=1208366 RepID=A0A8H4XG46_9HYPO|nr:hypothetical protein FSARC_568 [Fusarium sarcochroum]
MDYFNVEKGNPFNIEKGLSDVTVGLGWNVSEKTDKTMDLDAFAILKKGETASDMVYFNNKESRCGAVRLSGDNLTGKGDGDDEQLWFQLDKLPADVTEVLVWIVIYNGLKKHQTFEDVEGVHCRLFEGIDGINNRPLASFDVGGGNGETRSMHVATMCKDETWDFQRVEKGFNFDQAELQSRYTWKRD